MDEERRIKLESLLDDAIASEDVRRIEAIRRTIERETLECTAHTAERIKRIEKRQSEICEKLNSVCRQIEMYQAKLDGARLMLSILRAIVAAGGGAFIFKMIGG